MEEGRERDKDGKRDKKGRVGGVRLRDRVKEEVKG